MRRILQNRGEGFYRIEEKYFTEKIRRILQNRVEGFYKVEERDFTE